MLAWVEKKNCLPLTDDFVPSAITLLKVDEQSFTQIISLFGAYFGSNSIGKCTHYV